ncbi:MAG: 2,5-diamino-6-(ribosylamino)-4(3H)-pyrimidinone 5'-phosphate reductase [Candidatus Jordarchaeales archaeon]|nr:2,5-diamino-6-(ribosylamino)-4(3H)-pyrimidinone 5'-phosphate reductase [Candidatus Jordarchaeia archaeon]
MRNRPYVILNAAMSLDGKIATVSGDSEFSDEEDWMRVHRLRSEVDAIMVGVNTVIVDDPKLTSKVGRSPLRVIVDSMARTPPTARAITFMRGEVPTVIAVTGRAPAERVEELRKAGANVIVCGEEEKVNLEILMERLSEMGVKSLLLEGGGNLNWSMLEKGLVDEVRVAIAPVIVGGREAVTLVEGEGFSRVSQAVNVEFVKAERVGSCLLITCKVKGRPGTNS